MPASETLKIVVQLRDEANRNLAKLNKTLKGTERQATRSARAFAAFRGGLSRIRKSVLNMRTALVAAGAAFAAFAAGKKFLRAAQEQAKAVEGLNAALRAMGRFTPELSKNLQDTASALQQVTNFGDEATIEGTKFLVTYRNITDDVLPRTIKAMTDMAALTGGDMVSAANLLGKASLGMVDSLKRVGIDVDKAVFKAEGFVGVLKEIEAQVAGQAIAQRRATGSTIALGNSWGDVQEKLGEILKIGIEPFFRVLTEEVDSLNNFLARLKEEGNLDVWAREVSDSIFSFTEVIVKSVAVMIDAFRGLKLIWLGLKASFALLADFILQGMAFIVDVIDDVRGKLNELGVDAAKLGKILKWTPGLQGIGLILEKLEQTGAEVGETGDKIREQARLWEDVTNKTSDQIVELAAQDSYYNRADKWLRGLKTRVDEYAKEIGKATEETKKLVAGPEAAPEASLQARLKSALDRALALINTEQASIDAAYDKGLISLEEYFAARLRLTETAAQKEIEVLQKTADVEKDPSKRLAIEDKIFKRREKLSQDIVKIELDQFKAEEEIANSRLSITQTLADLRLQLAQSGAGNILERNALELQALEDRQAQEYQMLVDQNASKDQLEEANRLHNLQRDQEIAKQREAIHQLTITNIQGSLSQLSDAFGDAYAASGQQVKEFFYLQKAVAIAQAGIATYQNAIIAYQRGLEIPYVGAVLGPIFAAVAVAAGLARIAAIRNQSIAAGGKVKGYSPSDTADNITANLTAGEFVQPVKAVRHYGEGAMEAIRRRLVPREVLANYRAPKVLRGNEYFQAGGAVSAAARQAGTTTGTPEQQPININNIIDPQMMDQYVATKPGQRNIMNVLSENSFQLKQIILGE